MTCSTRTLPALPNAYSQRPRKEPARCARSRSTAAFTICRGNSMRPCASPLCLVCHVGRGSWCAAENKGDRMGALQIEKLKEGAGDEATAGKTVTVHYVGTLVS